MSSLAEITYVSDSAGKTVGLIAPTELWREIESERDTAYLLKSETMKRRLLEAEVQQGGVSLEEARAELGV